MTALRISPGPAALAITAAPALESAYNLTWQGAAPRVRQRDGVIDVRSTLAGRLRARSRRGGSLAIALNPAHRWTIEVQGGVSHLRASLRQLRLEQLAIEGGASDAVVELPDPRAGLALRVEGGVSDATVRRPVGVPLVMEIEGGASDLWVDDIHFSTVRHYVVQRTSDRANGTEAISLRIRGGARGLTVARLGSEPSGR